MGRSRSSNIAARSAIPINLLITIDPASRFQRPNLDQVRARVTTWIDVDSSPPPGQTNGTDATANWGGKSGDTVKEHASRYVVSPEKHGNFEAMMETKDAGGKSLADLVRGR